MLPKGILFDLDDTIIAYTPVAEPTWRKVCNEFTLNNNGLDPKNANDRNDDRNNDGYTNLEEYIR